MKARILALIGAVLLAAFAVAPARAQDADFGRFIGLIRGHLLTGDELVAQGQWDAARPHFSFPTEEIYGVIRDQVRGYKIVPFDGDLKALVRTVKDRNGKQFAKARAKVEAALTAADEALKARQPNWPGFVMAEAMAVLKTAPDEYDDAVAKGRIVHPVGYQTARGFILQAERMFESVAGGFAANNATAVEEIRAGFTQLKTAFASVNAPKQPAIEFQAVLDAVKRIEQAAAKLT